MTLEILFVEKDVTLADLLVPSLERKGYQVAVAHSQRQATARSRSARPDLLIVDVVSFGSRGYRIGETIRAQLEGVATILLVPHGHQVAAASADAFMTPPFTSRKLIFRVRKVAETLPRRGIQVGELTLDPKTCMLHKPGGSVRLRPKEAALLALFLRNPGRVLSRREIMREVWETDYLGDTGTLNVHVRWLRCKIEDDPGAPRCLRTIRGVGYRFDLSPAT